MREGRREEMEEKSYSTILAIIIFRWAAGDDKPHKSEGKEDFIGGGGSRPMVAYL